MMITKEEYLIDPCGTLSIPYWKHKVMNYDGITIIHDKEYDMLKLSDHTDEQYFRLYHDMKDISETDLEGFELIKVEKSEFIKVVSIINKAYSDIHVQLQDIHRWTQTPVYCEALWLFAIDKKNGEYAGCIIADYDLEVNELILEWVQVLPEYQRKGIGRLMVKQILHLMKDKADFATVSGKVDNVHQPDCLYRNCGFSGTDVWHILKKHTSSL